MSHWFAIRRELSPGRSLLLKVLSFLLPVALWCVVSYVPFVWHPLVRVTDAGDSTWLTAGATLAPDVLAGENRGLAEAGRRPAAGVPANPVFLPAPHEVARAFYSAFTTAPRRVGDVWLHEALAHSLRVILTGFGLAALVGVPVGLLCGTFSFASRLVEPFVDFVRYMPPPVFGALMIAVLGIDDGPKVAIIFIGTVFCMVRVVANTTRTLDPALLEAAQTLGTSRRRLVTRVILPGILPNLYHDLRILLGAAWTLLTVAELIGAMTGVSFFINQEGKYRHYENVFAGIAMIGLLGMAVDKVLSVVGGRLFPWQPKPAAGFWGEVWGVLAAVPRRRGRRVPLAGTKADADAAAVGVGADVRPGGEVDSVTRGVNAATA